jgi:ribose/xylose/arabinose/galactoside ABC-type transport system permease subunit
MLGSVFIAWFVMERTIFGRYIYAVGGNQKAAELSGVQVRRYRAAALVVCALFAVIAGTLLAARLGSGQPNAGERYLLDGLATVFIDMTMLRPGTATEENCLCAANLRGRCCICRSARKVRRQAFVLPWSKATPSPRITGATASFWRAGLTPRG